MQNLDNTEERSANLDNKPADASKKHGNAFQITQQVDTNTGYCIPKHPNFTPTTNKDAPAWQIVNNPSLATSLFTVEDADGETHTLSAAWISGFTDGEGTITFYLNRNSELAGGFQVQSAFVIVQGESDYYLLTAIANFFGCGSVTVNRKDKTSVRYQFRVVDPVLLFKKRIDYSILSSFTFMHKKRQRIPTLV